ncbi:hypothetical protein [Microbacterium sp. SS28]|uniref:hypothetical protein n=1 Tax=Microbacterium sp. SS28 TaxID=2919948 RepID=UPI001FA9EC6F|nr:hypothetical protein [Microbacterium sp. SS28]
MGLFAQRAEDNEEWAGLPSEPADQLNEAEKLRDAAPADAAGLGSLFGTSTVFVPLTAAEAEKTPADEAEGDEPDGDAA